MKKSKFTETQIVGFLKMADAGVPVWEVCRMAGISEPTYYVWKIEYGGMEASDLKRFKAMKAELSKLKRMYADLAMEKHAMKVRPRKTASPPCTVGASQVPRPPAAPPAPGRRMGQFPIVRGSPDFGAQSPPMIRG
jgi:putative transposase